MLVAFAPQTDAVREALIAAGCPVDAEETISVHSSSALKNHLKSAGNNTRLGLSGRPGHRVETEETARFYRHNGQQLVFTPTVLEDSNSYLADDTQQLLDSVVDELHLLQRHWRGSGLPLLVIPVNSALFQQNPEIYIQLSRQLESGSLQTISVQCDYLSRLAAQGQWVDLPNNQTPLRDINATPAIVLRDATDLRDLTAAEEQELDDISIEQLTQRLWSSSLLHEQAEVLELLQRRLGSQKVQLSRGKRPIELRQLLAEVYQHGLRCQDWNVVRRCAGAMGMVHPQLEDALTDLLVRQKQVVVGRNYTGESRLNQPQDSTAIAERIERTSGIDARERMLEQELLLALDSMVRREPSLLDGSLTLQLGQLLLLLTSELSGEQGLSQDEAFEVLCCEPPHRIRSRLRTVLTDVDHAKAALKRSEQLHVSGRVQWTVPDPLERRPGNGDWLQHRIRLGSLQQVPRDFYAGIWSLLQHCRGLVIGDKLERRNRLNSRLVLEKTAGERNFATLVDHLLSRIEAPEYRQLCCECLLSLMAFVETNADVRFDDDLALDVVIGHAVRVGWQHTHPSMHVDDYARHKAQAWGQFYLASPGDCRRWQVIALKELAEQNGLV